MRLLGEHWFMNVLIIEDNKFLNILRKMYLGTHLGLDNYIPDETR